MLINLSLSDLGFSKGTQNLDNLKSSYLVMLQCFRTWFNFPWNSPKEMSIILYFSLGNFLIPRLKWPTYLLTIGWLLLLLNTNGILSTPFCCLDHCEHIFTGIPSYREWSEARICPPFRSCYSYTLLYLLSLNSLTHILITRKVRAVYLSFSCSSTTRQGNERLCTLKEPLGYLSQ